MGTVLLTNLPYLMVYVIGIVIGLKKYRGQPLAWWAISCYVLLIILWAIRIWQVGSIVIAHEQGIFESEERWFVILSYVQLALYFCVTAVLMITALQWRDGIEGRMPLMLVIISAVLIILNSVISRLPLAPGLMPLFQGGELGATIAVTMAVYGWRKG